MEMIQVAEMMKLKSIYDSSQARKGKKPQFKPDEIIIEEHRNVYRAYKRNGDTSYLPTAASTVFDMHSSHVHSFTDLCRIGLHEMFLETCHKGSYLVCRLIEKPYKVAGIMTVVEDHAGNISDLSLYNYVLDPSPDLELILPVGTILAIKEPYLKNTKNDGVMVRCDTPSDVVVIYYNDDNYQSLKVSEICWNRSSHINIKQQDEVFAFPIPSNAAEWKARGNALFANKKFIHAVRAYDQGIRICETESSDDEHLKYLNLNRSACFLALGRYDDALHTSQQVLALDETNTKAMHRAGKAYYHLCQYVDAARMFQMAYRGSNSAESDTEFKQALARVREQKGKFDLNRMSEKPSLRLDHADYIGPIEILNSTGKGRGFFATSDIEPGKMIMACKAFEISYHSELSTHIVQNNFHSKFINSPIQVQLINRIAHKVYNTPSLTKSLYQLWSGSDKDVIDNCFVDIELIDRICCLNAFKKDKTMLIRTTNPTRLAPGELEDDDNSGLWLLPSYFNHSCLPNATRSFIGDVMLIFANRKILKGSEITIGYIDSHLKYSERKEKLAKFGFCCSCLLCQEDKDDPFEVMELISKFENEVLPKVRRQEVSILPLANRLVARIKKAYHSVGRFELLLKLWVPLSAVGSLYGMLNDYENAIKIQEELFQLCNVNPEKLLSVEESIPEKAFLSPILVLCALQAWGACSNAGKFIEAKKWNKVARKLEAFNGLTPKMFKAKHRKLEEMAGMPL